MNAESPIEAKGGGTQERALAFVDLAGFTALTEQHGDLDAADCAARFYALAGASLRGDTKIVKRIGDAVMLVATSAWDCLSSVVAIAEAADREPTFPGLRAGVHFGAVVERDQDYFGATVNLASRIAAHARAGEILVSQSVAAAATNQGGPPLHPLGGVMFKNVAHPVAVWSLDRRARVEGEVDPVCRMRIAAPTRFATHGGRSWAFCSDGCLERFPAAPESFSES